MFKSRSLKFKLIGIITGILVVLGVTMFTVLRSIDAHIREVAANMIESNADKLGEAISAQFFERYGDVQAFAINPDVQSGKREVIEAALNGYSALYLIYDLIVVADTQGRVIAMTTKDPSGKDINVSEFIGSSVADKAWFQKTLKGEFTADKEKGFNGTYVEDIHVDEYVSKVYGEKRIGNSFNAQIKNARGEVVGVISNRAGSRWYEGELVVSYAKLKEAGYQSAHLQVLNQNGVVVAELDPASTNGGKEASNDHSRILSKNYKEASAAFALGLAKGEKGHYYSFDEEKDAKFGFGYAPVDSSKFVNSIGWSVVLKISEHDVMADTNKLEYIAFSVLALIFAISQVVGWYFSSSLSRFFSDLSAQLLENTDGVNDVAKKLSGSSNSLSSATTEQAAALQETVSAIDEVSAMVGKNADNAKKSQEVSADSAASAEKGKHAVDQMIQAITDINQSNQEIMREIENSNAEIKNIVNVISEIGNKTKVINDIVFQTKLLSFNASVEAARAGEHGKGFAVVAEEVGNLAQMSGNAAKEISDMLGNSIKKVESIVQNSQGRIQSLVGQAREKVEHGTVTAKNCGEVLEEVVHSVSTVNQMLSEIATASREQSQGVNEINKAMNQMDQVTQTNASIAQESAHSAQTLENQCEQLKEMVHQLLHTVEGRDSGAGRDTGGGAEVVQFSGSKRGDKAA